MPDEATSAIEAGIRSAFTAYSRDDDPDWRSATWIKPEECSHLAMSILQELPLGASRSSRRRKAALLREYDRAGDDNRSHTPRIRNASGRR
jgi:hypothetical protein